MISKETLIALMGHHEAELREYRLSGDAEYLLPLINHALDADTGCFAQDFFNALTDNESIPTYHPRGAHTSRAARMLRRELGASDGCPRL
jgi:hypothetical protein